MKLALETLKNAQSLLTEEDRISNYPMTLALYLKLAEYVFDRRCNTVRLTTFIDCISGKVALASGHE